MSGLVSVEACPFWTPESVAQVRSATSFKEVADVALGILRVMPQPIFQVCGPMSTGGLGCREKNLAVFFECVEELRNRGFSVFDQIPLQLGFDRLVEEWKKTNEGYCVPILTAVYWRIFRSGFVKTAFFLPDWRTSWGTKWERRVVVRCGLDVCEFPPDWYESAVDRVVG
ncbi:MAG: hypothetical protein AAB726_02905 [Patescibacteria group bacterium]